MDKNEAKQQFQNWLPYFVNGRLNDIDRAWMNSYLAENPKASLDVEIERSLKQALHDELPHFAADKGLNDFMARVRSEASTTQRPAFAESCKRFIQQCQAAVGSLFVSPRWAMAMTVLVVQAALIGVLISHRTTPIVTTQSEWRSVSSPSQYQGPVLQITFKPTATEEGIRLLLVQIGGSFLDGPGQLGNYIVKVSGNKIDEAKAQVKDSPITDSVQVLQEWPIDQ